MIKVTCEALIPGHVTELSPPDDEHQWMLEVGCGMRVVE